MPAKTTKTIDIKITVRFHTKLAAGAPVVLLSPTGKIQEIRFTNSKGIALFFRVPALNSKEKYIALSFDSTNSLFQYKTVTDPAKTTITFSPSGSMGDIHVFVLTNPPARVPLQGATVEVIPEGATNSITNPLLSDSEGKVDINGLNGNYTVKVSYQSYPFQTKTVSISASSDDRIEFFFPAS